METERKTLILFIEETKGRGKNKEKIEYAKVHDISELYNQKELEK